MPPSIVLNSLPSAQALLDRLPALSDQLAGLRDRATAGPPANLRDPAVVRAALAERDLALVALVDAVQPMLALAKDLAIEHVTA